MPPPERLDWLDLITLVGFALLILAILYTGASVWWLWQGLL